MRGTREVAGNRECRLVLLRICVLCIFGISSSLRECVSCAPFWVCHARYLWVHAFYVLLAGYDIADPWAMFWCLASISRYGGRRGQHPC